MRFFRLLTPLLALAALLLSATGASAADPLMQRLETKAPAQLTVGGRVTYVIHVDADRGSKLTLAPDALPPYLAVAAPAQFTTTDSARGEDRVVMTLTVEAAVFLTGNLSVPPLKVRVTGPTGSTTDLQTDASNLFVDSVLPASGELVPRELKPQAEIGSVPFNYTPYIAGAGAAFIVLALGLMFFVRRRRHVLVPVVVPVLVTEGPEDRARRALDEAGARFAADHDYATYYETISLTIRAYLTARHEFPAYALTTRELSDAMGVHNVDRWQARLVNGLLVQCDAVVFAHYRPALPRADSDLTTAYEIVEMSRPAAPETEPVAEAVTT